MKQNCWEIRKCGRESKGVKSREFGICPAATVTEAEGINGGRNGGRICWAVAGTMCGKRVHGEFAQRRLSCITCEVFEKVREEEGDLFH